MIVHRATLDVRWELVQFTQKPLRAERRSGHLAGSRALTCFWQAVLAAVVPRPQWPDALARDHGISRATAYSDVLWHPIPMAH